MYMFFMYHYISIHTYRTKNAELDRLKWLPNLPHQGLVKHQELYLRPRGWDCCIHQPDSPGSPPVNQETNHGFIGHVGRIQGVNMSKH